MITYILRRLNLLLLTLFILVMASYWLVHAFPGDPIANLSGVNYTTAEQKSYLDEYYQTDKNQFNQFIRYLELLWQMKLVTVSILKVKILVTPK